MKLLEILQKELKQFPEGMLYAVQDYDGKVKFGKHSQPSLWSSGVWNRYEDANYLINPRSELAEDWDSAIVTKEMWENDRNKLINKLESLEKQRENEALANDRMKQIIVNVSGLSEEEKHHVNEALEKITGATKLPAINPKAAWFYAPASCGGDKVSWNRTSPYETPTHTPQQVLEMAGMAGMVKQGHAHADLMAQYAEDAKTTDKPWELWQFKDCDGIWWECDHVVLWCEDTEYRRKHKTHIVNGIEVPDLRIVPKNGGRFYLADPTEPEFTYSYLTTTDSYDSMWAERGLCYENTEEGKQAAILHAKAWLGIA